MKNFNTIFGLGDGIVQRSQAVYETVSGRIWYLYTIKYCYVVSQWLTGEKQTKR